MPNYHDVKLPNFIAACAVGESHFSTKLAESASGREIRFAERQYSIQKYKVINCILNQEQFDEFNSFFRNRYGARYCFRLKDFSDYKVHKQLIAKYPNAMRSFNFVKYYNNHNSVYTRPILRPIIHSLKVYINDEPIIFDVDPESLAITISRALAYNEELFISFEFDVNVRFYSDYFSYHLREDGSIAIERLDLIEVLHE